MNKFNNAVSSIALFFKKYEFYFLMAIKFVLALLILMRLKADLGYSTFFANTIIIIGLALACAVIPSNMFVLIIAIVTLAHLYRLSLVMCVIAGLVFLVVYLMYLKFAPEQGMLLAAVPALMPFGLHFVIPMGAGLLLNPFTIVPTCGGVIIYYMLSYMKSAAGTTGTGTEIKDMIESVKVVLDGIMNNKEMMVVCMVFIAIIVAVFLIGQRSFKYAWYVGLAAGAAIGIIAIGIFNKFLGGTLPMGKTAFGIILAALLVGIYQFLFHNVDYAKKESLQFEDEDYVYFVKAIPKKVRFDEPEEEPTIKEALSIFKRNKDDDEAGAAGDTIIAPPAKKKKKRGADDASQALPGPEAGEAPAAETIVAAVPGEEKPAKERRSRRARRAEKAVPAAAPGDIDASLEDDIMAEDRAFEESSREKRERPARRRKEKAAAEKADAPEEKKERRFGRKKEEPSIDESLAEYLVEPSAQINNPAEAAKREAAAAREKAADNIPEISRERSSFFASSEEESFDEITLEDAGHGSFDDM